MKALERLERLVGWTSQGEFEVGGKHLGSVLTRKVVRKVGPEVVNPLSRLISLGGNDPRMMIESVRAREDEFMAPAWDLFVKNLYVLPRGLSLRASPFHGDSWLRDSFIGTLFLGSSSVLSEALLSSFEDRRIHPQMPTTRLAGGNRVWRFDDESTMLGILWKANLQKGRGSLSEKEKQLWGEKWQWVKGHVEDGLYVSPEGSMRSWFDTFKFPRADVITYNQGVYAATALAAHRMGLEDDSKVVKEAQEGYQSLIHPSGRLQFSKHYPYKDVSALFGEFLSLRILEEPILSDKTVKATVSTLPRTETGYKVVVRENDSYLDPSEFDAPYRPGDYQNGADWPLFSATARAVGMLHGLPHDQLFWIRLFAELRRTNHVEYFGNNGGREDNLWNTAVYEAARMVFAEGELKMLAQFTKPVVVEKAAARYGIYSE